MHAPPDHPRLPLHCDPSRQRAARFPVLSVSVTQAMLDRASAYGRDVELHLPPTENHSGIEHPHRYRNGFLAEFAFVVLLTNIGRRLHYAPQTDGKPDPGSDVTVWRGGQEVGINVKVGSRVSHSYMMIPESLWQRDSHTDLYLGGRLDLESDPKACELWGTATQVSLMQCRVRHPGDGEAPRVLAPTRLIPLSQLQPIESLVRHLDAGPACITKAIP